MQQSKGKQFTMSDGTFEIETLGDKTFVNVVLKEKQRNLRFFLSQEVEEIEWRRRLGKISNLEILKREICYCAAAAMREEKKDGQRLFHKEQALKFGKLNTAGKTGNKKVLETGMKEEIWFKKVRHATPLAPLSSSFYAKSGGILQLKPNHIYRPRQSIVTVV
jgi:hypothetical protein